MLRSTLITAAVAVTMFTATASAETFTVTRTDDPAPNGCVADDCSLREAILAANANGGFLDDVKLDATTYVLQRTGGPEDEGNFGDLDVMSEIRVVGAGAGVTRIDATRTDRVFHVGPQLTIAELRLDDLRITGGRVDGQGGGILAGDGDEVFLTRAVVVDNETIGSGRDGGGIHTGGILELVDSAVVGNRASGDGGGIASNGSDTVKVKRSTISGNRAGLDGSSGDGGGIYVSGSGGANVETSTLAGNKALGPSGDGGGFYTAKPSQLTNVTITDNESGDQGAATNGEDILAHSVLIAGNRAGETFPGRFNCGHQLDSAGVNLEDRDGCGLDHPTDKPGAGDAKLGPLASNGGPTQTVALLPGSPAIDAGLTLGCFGTDQRGVARPQRDRCDIGAFEAEPEPPAAPPAPPAAGGGAAGPAQVAPTAQPDTATPRGTAARRRVVVSRASIARRVLRFRLDVSAAVRVTIARRTARGKLRTVKTVRVRGKAGLNRVRLGRLARGRYRVTVTAGTADTLSVPRRLGLRL